MESWSSSSSSLDDCALFTAAAPPPPAPRTDLSSTASRTTFHLLPFLPPPRLECELPLPVIPSMMLASLLPPFPP